MRYLAQDTITSLYYESLVFNLSNIKSKLKATHI